jgi:hypothetical protein
MSGKVSGTSSGNFVGVKSWESGNDSVGSGGISVSLVVCNFSGPNFGSIGDGSFTAGGSESGHMGSTSSSDFGSVLDGLWWSPDWNLRL